MKEVEFNNLCELARNITGVDVRFTRSRKKEFVQIRCALINVMRKYYSTNTVQTADLMKLDHTTIIHHTKDHPSRYRYEDDYADLYDKLVRYVMNSSETISTDKMIHLMRNALSVE
jgi:hypothetical protein